MLTLPAGTWVQRPRPLMPWKGHWHVNSGTSAAQLLLLGLDRLPFTRSGLLRAGAPARLWASREQGVVTAVSRAAAWLAPGPQSPLLALQVHVCSGEPRLHRGLQVPDRHRPISFVVCVPVQCVTDAVGYLGVEISKHQTSLSHTFN